MSYDLSKNMAWGGLFMIALFKHQLLRLWQDKKNLFLYLCLTAGSIIVAIVMSHQNSKFASVAVIRNTQMPVIYEENVDVHYVDERPLETDLVTQTYDAIIEYKVHQWVICSYKTEDFENQLLQLLTLENISLPQDKHTGETIFGFMIMFVMMEALFYTSLYGEDKEKKMLQRISISGMSMTRYLYSQSLLTFLMTWGSTFSILLLTQLFGMEIGFSLTTYAFLLTLLCLIATAFAMMMNSIFDKETTSLSASATIVLTSLLSGTFYSFMSDDGIIGICINALPQKALMNISENINYIQNTQWLEILYLLGLVIVFYTFAIVVGKKSIIKSHS